MKAAKDLYYNPKLFGFTVGPATPDFIEVLGDDAEYVVTSSQWSDTVPLLGVPRHQVKLPTPSTLIQTLA